MDETPSFQVLLSEHNYFKARSEDGDAEPMDIGESASTAVNSTSSQKTSQSPSLTRLDAIKDSFETCLIQLLQAYTANQRSSNSESSPGETNSSSPATGEERQAFIPPVDISPESLSSLSTEQVSTLVTSNSVNYEVIQQIMAQKHNYHGIPSKTGGAYGLGGAMGGANNNNNGGDKEKSANSKSGNNEPSSRKQQTREGVCTRSMGKETNIKSTLSGEDPSTNLAPSPSQPNSSSSKQSVVQVTPEQLQLLQQQVSDLLRSKQVSLPADMTSHQQQKLIQDVLLKQLSLQQGQQLVTLQQKEAQAGTISKPSASPPLEREEKEQEKEEKEEKVGERPSAIATATATTSGKKEAPPTHTSSSLESLLTSKVPSQQGEKEKQKVPTPSSSLPSAGQPAVASSPSPPASETSKESSTEVMSSSTNSSPSLSSTSSTSTKTASPPVRASPSKAGSRRKKGDSNKNEPKKPPMPYNIFFSEVYSTVHAANPKMAFADASRIISMMWNAMGTDVKQKYYDRHEELKAEYKVALDKTKEQQQQTAQQPANMDESVASSPPEKSEESHLKNEEEKETSAVKEGEGEEGAEAMDTSPQEVKDPSLCVNEGCVNKAVFGQDRGPQYCSNECVVMDTRNVFASWVRNRKIRD